MTVCQLKEVEYGKILFDCRVSGSVSSQYCHHCCLKNPALGSKSRSDLLNIYIKRMCLSTIVYAETAFLKDHLEHYLNPNLLLFRYVK